MSTKIITIAFSCLLVVSVLIVPVSFVEAGDTKTESNHIMAIGRAEIEKGNLAQAKKNAISQALLKGMEDYLLKRLGSKGVVNNFQTFMQDLLPEAKEGIENFNILVEDRIGNEYTILLRLRVNEKMLDEKMRETGLALIEGPSLKVLFLASENRGEGSSFWWKDPGAQSNMNATDLVLKKVFLRRGFNPVNRTTGIQQSEYTPAMGLRELDDSDAVRWGNLFHADLVIHGQTDILDSGQVSVSLKALDVRHGVAICQGTQLGEIGAGVVGRTSLVKALRPVIGKLVARMNPCIGRAISEDDRSGFFEITLKGLTSYKQFREFKKFLLMNVNGVKSVKRSKIGSDYITVKIEFSGNKSDFLGNFSSNMESLPIQVNIGETDEGEIFFSILE